MTHRLTGALAGLALAAALPCASSLAQAPSAPRPAAPPTLTQQPAQAPVGQLAPQRPATPPGTPQNSQSDSIPVPDATPAHLALARELVITSGLSRSFEGLIPDLSRQINATVTRTRPELTKDLKDTLDRLQPEFLKQSDIMLRDATRIYVTLMSEQECRELVTFWKSPIGKKFIDVQPIVFGNISDLMPQWTRYMSQWMMDIVREDMKKKGHQI